MGPLLKTVSTLVGVFWCFSLPSDGSVAKRGILDTSTGFGNANPPLPFLNPNLVAFGYGNHLLPAPAALAIPLPLKHLVQKVPFGPSSAEIASAVTAAKEASASVLAAQHRVQAAKEDVIAQQRIASHKEAEAALALQKTEAAAAVLRQQAHSAANAVIQAQQRLAQAKADVATQQRIAASKEAQAAEAIHSSAAAAAEQVHKTEQTAAKLAAIQRSEAAAALKHIKEAKDATLSATSAAVEASSGFYPATGPAAAPWLAPGKLFNFVGWQ